MPAASLRAQAKLNLFLRILAREDDGYHQLETLFCRLDLADTIVVERTTGARSLHCAGPALPGDGIGAPHDNLAWRAAAHFLDATGSSAGFRIEIDKQIPVGAGLGGGSADAGAVLRLMQHLHGGVDDRQLLAIAGSLGADVPFLTQTASPLALAWGRGERLLPLPALPARPCLVVSAPFGVATAAAYGWVDEVGKGRVEPALRRAGWLATWEAIADEARNDFTPVVLARHPVLGEALDLLRRGVSDASCVGMSGSGAALFAVGGAAPLPSQLPGLPAGFRLLPTRTADAVASIVPR